MTQQDKNDTPIRDAACVVVVDRRESEPRVLMGRRRTTQVFLPNKWVFPGGRVDDEDRALAVQLAAHTATELAAEASEAAHDHDAIRLSFVLAAIRELFEEAGLLLDDPLAARMALPATWQQFSRSGRMPAIAQLSPLARAITPPGLPRRFDTWFFLAERSNIAKRTFEPDGELLDLDWFTLERVRELDLPHITRLIVDDVASALVRPEGSGNPVIPFYFQGVAGYQRTLISALGEAPLP